MLGYKEVFNAFLKIQYQRKHYRTMKYFNITASSRLQTTPIQTTALENAEAMPPGGEFSADHAS